MKKSFYMSLPILMLVYSNNSRAAFGCQDNSYHMQKDTYYANLAPSLQVTPSEDPNIRPLDSKDYHYVQCTCPCEQHKIINRRGRCVECRHFGRADRSSQFEPTQDQVNLALLAKIVEDKK